jgi:hypothetical protein
MRLKGEVKLLANPIAESRANRLDGLAKTDRREVKISSTERCNLSTPPGLGAAEPGPNRPREDSHSRPGKSVQFEMRSFESPTPIWLNVVMI